MTRKPTRAWAGRRATWLIRGTGGATSDVLPPQEDVRVRALLPPVAVSGLPRPTVQPRGTLAGRKVPRPVLGALPAPATDALRAATALSGTAPTHPGPTHPDVLLLRPVTGRGAVCAMPPRGVALGSALRGQTALVRTASVRRPVEPGAIVVTEPQACRRIRQTAREAAAARVGSAATSGRPGPVSGPRTVEVVRVGTSAPRAATRVRPGTASASTSADRAARSGPASSAATSADRAARVVSVAMSGALEPVSGPRAVKGVRVGTSAPRVATRA